MKASAFVGTSLDGFLARRDGAFDFLLAGNDEPSPHGFEEFLASVDAIVMGRNTYDVVLPMPTWPYGDKPVFVLSNRPLPSGPAGVAVERMAGEPTEIFAALAARGLRHVYVDGGITIQAFIRAGLVHHLTVTRVPVLIGSGIALFGAVDADIRLTHITTRQLPGGGVQSEYSIEPSRVTMDQTQLTDFATRYAAAWSSQSPASLASFYAEDGSLTVNGGAPSIGRAAITTTAHGFMSGFPDMLVKLDQVSRDNGRVTFRWIWTGTNTGPGGTGKSVRIRGYEEWTIGADGLIKESKGHYDEAEYQRQLQVGAPPG